MMKSRLWRFLVVGVIAAILFVSSGIIQTGRMPVNRAEAASYGGAVCWTWGYKWFPQSRIWRYGRYAKVCQSYGYWP